MNEAETIAARAAGLIDGRRGSEESLEAFHTRMHPQPPADVETVPEQPPGPVYGPQV